MDIFISWSGIRSKKIAIALRDWLPRVIQALEPWMSASDIDKGARWLNEISERLDKTNFGIICLTPENRDEPWVLFEVGALSKALGDTFVCPLLFELEPSTLKGPISQFQATKLEEEDVLLMLQSINKRLGEKRLPEDQLKETFNVWWPKLDTAIKNIEPAKKEVHPQRDVSDMLEEILSMLRRFDRNSATREENKTSSITIDDVLRTLTPKEEAVVRGVCGIRQDRRTVVEISAELGISKKKAQEILNVALRKLKHPSRLRALRQIEDLDNFFETT